DLLARDVDELVVLVVRRERADRLVVAGLVGDLAAERLGVGRAVVEPHVVALALAARREPGRLDEQLLLAVPLDDDRDAGRAGALSGGGLATRGLGAVVRARGALRRAAAV